MRSSDLSSRASMSAGKKLIFGVFAALLAVLLLVVVGVVFVVPSIASKMVQERLDRAASRLNLEITTTGIDTVGLGGVELTGIAVRDPASGRTLVTVARAGGRVSVPRLLVGERVVTDIWSHDVDVTLTREANGDFDLLEVARRARKPDDAAEDEPTEPPAEGGILRHFGGTLPGVDVTDVQVTFAHADGASPFPLQTLAVPMLEIAHEDGIEVRTKVTVTSLEGGEFTLPGEVDVAMVLNEELVPQTLNVGFDRAVEVAGLEPLPFLRAGFAGVELSPEGLVMLTDAHLGFRNAENPFAQTKRVALSVAKWALDPREIIFANLTVDSPRLALNYDAQGASELGDLDHALRAPRARDVVAHARRFAAEIDERRKAAATSEPADVEAEAEEEIAADAPSPADPTDDEPGRLERWLARIPHTVEVRDAVVDILDQRNLPVERRARALRLDDGALELTHDVDAHTFRVQGGFQALADEQKRGSVKGLVALGYRSKQVDADLEIDALDLSWVGQMLGPSVAENVRGGTLRAKVDVKPAGKGRAVTIDGNVSVEDLVYYWDLLAEEPVQDFTASYGFTATYDPDGKTPPARLLKNGLFKDSNTPAADDPIHAGSLVFSRGNVQVGAARMEVRPAVYGTGALPSRMPSRVDLQVDLPATDVQVLFDAVPTAVQGPLQGTQLSGTFAWKLDLELPPYRAGDMEWVSTPVLDEEFAIVSIPKEVDPNNLMTGFRHTITVTLQDKKGEEYEWSRTVRIPKAEPVSAKYLIENANIDLETLDAQRREREWPPVPDPKRSWVPKTVIESPEYWLTTSAESLTAKRPWADDDVIERSEDEPYGAYVFVPLHHISKWVVRTVTTTEDGGFFRHPGFLFDSLKESVEDNIEANRFRRGGSTISMQLVKNAFLDQKKLLARKIREAFLVFLMETVVDVPKERILEVYLNIIEFGPAIYGIHDAAVHYFGKRPDQLDAAETAWLFSILPAPKKYHFYWEKGEISDRWFAKMKRYIDAMTRRNKMTEEERDAVQAAPAFYKPDVAAGDPVLRPAEPPEGFVPLLEGEPADSLFPPPTTPQAAPPQNAPIPTGTAPKNPPAPKKKKGWFWNR